MHDPCADVAEAAADAAELIDAALNSQAVAVDPPADSAAPGACAPGATAWSHQRNFPDVAKTIVMKMALPFDKGRKQLSGEEAAQMQKRIAERRKKRKGQKMEQGDEGDKEEKLTHQIVNGE